MRNITYIISINNNNNNDTLKLLQREHIYNILYLTSIDDNDNNDNIPHTRNMLYRANKNNNNNSNKAYYKARNAN